MNLKQLYYFITVAEELHFGRAARRLHISQPPLSMSIQQLEQHLGFNLFLRNNKNVSLTDAGALFYQEALMLIKHAQDMQQIGQRVAQGTLGQLRIGFTSSSLFRGLNQFILDFQTQYPHIKVILKELNSSEQLQALRQEQINIGFVHALTQSEHIAHRVYLQEDFVCCLPQSHPLAQQEQINLIDLQHENFLLFPRTASPNYYDQVTAICINAGFSPLISHEIRNWLTIVKFVELGLGVALVPRSMQSTNQHDVRFIRLNNNPICSYTYCVWNQITSSIIRDNFLNLVFADQTI